MGFHRQMEDPADRPQRPAGPWRTHAEDRHLGGRAAAATAVRTVPTPSYYFRHVGESAASLARLVKDNSVEHVCVGRVTAWTHERRGGER
jgi:hypothetical protein